MESGTEGVSFDAKITGSVLGVGVKLQSVGLFIDSEFAHAPFAGRHLSNNFPRQHGTRTTKKELTMNLDKITLEHI